MSSSHEELQRLGVAVVGTGWGCLTHVPALRAAGFDVRTLVGTNEARTKSRAELSGVSGYTTNLASVLDDVSIQAVVVATPPETHVGVVLDVVEAGKHVFSEKPFATSDEDAIQMRDAARSRGVVNVVGHEFRWNPQNVAMAECIRSGAIGAPTMSTHIRFSGVLAGPSATAPEWFESGGSFGGWTNAEVQHVIDEVRLSVGEFASLSAVEGQSTPHDWDAADTFAVQFTTASGAMGVIQSSIGAMGPRINVQRVCGTKGSVWLEGDETIMLDDGSGERRMEPPEWLESAPSASHPAERVVKDIGGANTLSAALTGATRFFQPTTLLHRTFRDRILGVEERPWPPLPTFDDGVANTAAHSAIRRSIETGQSQDLSSAKTTLQR